MLIMDDPFVNLDDRNMAGAKEICGENIGKISDIVFHMRPKSCTIDT